MNEVRAIRTKLKMDRLTLAKELGVHRSTISRWETGAIDAPIAILRLLRIIAAEKRRKAA